MRPTDHDTAYWLAVASGISLTDQIIWWALWLFFWWMKYRIISRAGYDGWWKSLLWSIPIVGWFFKLWFAFTPWPERKGKKKRASPTKRKSRKRAVA